MDEHPLPGSVGGMDATRRAGVEGTTIHDLRHTAAFLLIAAGPDVKAVQVILGHSTATMLMDLYGLQRGDRAGHGAATGNTADVRAASGRGAGPIRDRAPSRQ